MLSELLGPKGMAFDNDDVLDDDADDEDLKNDPISQMDMQASPTIPISRVHSQISSSPISFHSSKNAQRGTLITFPHSSISSHQKRLWFFASCWPEVHRITNNVVAPQCTK